MCASAAAHDLVPVHDEPLAMLLLTDAAEESGNAELHDTVQNEVGTDACDAVIGFDLQGKSRLVASRHLGGAGKAPALEVGNGEVVVTFRQDDELLTIVLDGVIPIHAGVVVDVISHDKNPPLLVQDRAVRVDKVQNLRPVFDEPAGDEFLGIAVDGSVGGIVSLVRHDLLKLRIRHIRIRHEGAKAVDGLDRIGGRPGTRLEEVCDVFEVQVHLFRQVVAVLGVPARMVRGIDDALAALGFLGVRLSRDHIGLVIKEVLQSKTVYYPCEEVYEYKPRGLEETEYPEYPYPEVIGYVNNDDGTLTLKVQAVFPYRGVSKAYIHEVTVRDTKDGGIQYVGNRIIEPINNPEIRWHVPRLTRTEWEELYGDN